MKRFRFLPAEENFLEVFEEIATVLVEAAECLHELVTDYDNLESYTRKLREMEKRSDIATANVCKSLNNSFVTPFDRDDIHSLASSMDEVLDYIEASADRMKLYGVDKPRLEAAELAALLVDATKMIQQAVRRLVDLRDVENVMKYCVEINHIENSADQVERRALIRLFKEETRPLEIAKWQEIFDRMETATDRCEDVANVIESIVVKNA